jgi:hypothetical protein
MLSPSSHFPGAIVGQARLRVRHSHASIRRASRSLDLSSSRVKIPVGGGITIAATALTRAADPLRNAIV